MKKCIILMFAVFSFNLSFSQQKDIETESDIFSFVDVALDNIISSDDLELNYDFYKHVRVDSFACMYWYSKHLAQHPEFFKFRTVLELLHSMEDAYSLMNKKTGFETPFVLITKSISGEKFLEITVGGDYYRHITLRSGSDAKISYTKNGVNDQLDYDWRYNLFATFYTQEVSVIKLKNADKLLYTSYHIEKGLQSCSDLDLYAKGIKSNYKSIVDLSKISEDKETIVSFRRLKGMLKGQLQN